MTTTAVSLTPVAELCGAGECPTVYRTDRGTLVIQGYRFGPDGAPMVEVPAELLDLYATQPPAVR